MITTIEGVIESMALEQGKMKECDMWIGRAARIRHVVTVMFVEDNVLYIRGKEHLLHSANIDGTTGYTRHEENMAYTVPFLPDERIVFAHSYDEAKADATLLTEEIRTIEQKENEILKDELLDKFAALSLRLVDASRSTRSELGEIIKEDKRYSDLVHFIMYSMGFREPDEFTEDVQIEMSLIFQTQMVRFHDRDNDDIETFIPLANITSITPHIIYCGKHCACIRTADEHEYYVYKKQNKDVYYALMFLYE